MVQPIFIRCPKCAGRGSIPRGEYLRQHRLHVLRLKLRELARQMKLTPQYLWDIEHNKRQATPKIVEGYGL